MKIRLATKNDLPNLKIMFSKIVKKMESENIFIWNEFYPFEEFENDIENKNLYLVRDKEKIISAFCLCTEIEGSENFQWSQNYAHSLYLCKFGVNVEFQNKGFGSSIISEIFVLAKNMGAEYLRLKVVDSNIPALKFYQKNNFLQVFGKFEEFIESKNLSLTEYGFEKKL